MLVATARGRTNNEIGAELHMSLGTVKTHLGNLQAKVAARNRVELAACCRGRSAMLAGVVEILLGCD